MEQKPRSTLLVRVGAVPNVIWGPIVAGFLLLTVGVIGWAAGRPLLFPSLGPSAFEDAEQPELESSHFYNTLIGHWVGLGAGLLAVALLNAWDEPVALETRTLTMTRVGASVLAVVLTLAILTLLHASHPSSAATTLLVSLGSFRTGSDAVTVIIGALIIAVLGEIARRIRLRAIRESHSPLV